MVAFTAAPGVDASYMLHVVAQHMRDDPALKNARLLELELDYNDIARDGVFNARATDKLMPLFEGLAERGGVFQERKIILGISNVDCYKADGIKVNASANLDGGRLFIENFFRPIFQGCLGMVMTGSEQGITRLIDNDQGLARRMEQIKVLSIDKACRARIMPKIKLKKP